MKRKLLIVVGVLLLLGGTIAYFINKDSNKTFIKETTESTKNVIAAYVIQEDGTYKEVESIPQEGYQLNISKSTCSNGTIPGWDVKNKRFYADNLTKGGTSCYLYFDKYVPTASETILANVTVKTDTPDFSQVATTDEGVYAVEDGMYGGTSYYWRGAATTNYATFAGFCWRIVRINGDKTIRLIYDGSTCHQNGESTTDSIAVSNVAYNTLSNQSSYVGWTYEKTLQRPSSTTVEIASNAKTELENWYDENIIETNASKVVQGKYCNDRNAQSGNTWGISGSTFYYAAYKRIITDRQPTLSCPSDDIYMLNVGLITADEVMYAGGKESTANTSYYLRNGQNYWTMSPYYWSSGAFTSMFAVNSNGHVSDWGVNNTKIGLCPVINLRSDVTFSGGNGTLNNPYVVAD